MITFVDDEIVGFSADVAFSDAGQQKSSDCVLSGEMVTSSPMIAMSLLPSPFLTFGFICDRLNYISC